jgi:hypothetical protein
MQGPDTDAQDHPLHLFTSGLQRTAGPYSWVKGLNRSRGRALGLAAQRSNGRQSILTSVAISLLCAMIEDMVICKSMAEYQALRLQESNSGARHLRA